MKNLRILDALSVSIVIVVAAALAYAFTSPINNPGDADSSSGALLYQIAGINFDGSTDSLKAISTAVGTVNTNTSNIKGAGYDEATDSLTEISYSVNNIYGKGWTIIYPSNAQHAGDLGNRAAVDAICVADRPIGVDCDNANTHAFISYPVDAINEMPKNYGFDPLKPVYGYDSFIETTMYIIANSWGDMLDNSITSMISRGLDISSSDTYWTGSYSNGSIAGWHCSSWADGTATGDGYFGLANSITTSWISQAGADTCNTPRYILCACISNS